MTLVALKAGILLFCTRLFSELGVPVVQTEVIRQMPLKLRVGVTIPDVSPEVVLSACTAAAQREAWLATWPNNFAGNCPPSSIGIAADNQHVIFDLVFYSVKIELEESLKPAPAPEPAV